LIIARSEVLRRSRTVRAKENAMLDPTRVDYKYDFPKAWRAISVAVSAIIIVALLVQAAGSMLYG
jgi:uncharacterized protein YfaA (DUF2138 family)